MNSTLLKKYETIDQSKVTEKDKKVLEQLKKLTNNFEETDEAKNKVAEKILNQIALLNPDAVKKPQVVAQKVAKANKVVKAKKPATAPAAKSSGNNIMSIAKEIQKSGESWKDAMERAKQVLKERREQIVEKKKTEMEKLLALVRTKKELQGFANSDIERDAVRASKAKGSRVVTKEGFTSNQYKQNVPNKLGRKYWESRENRSDRLAPNYQKDMPLLASGGAVSDAPFSVEVFKTKLRFDNELTSSSKGDFPTFAKAKEFAIDMIDNGNYYTYINSKSGYLWGVGADGVEQFANGGSTEKYKVGQKFYDTRYDRVCEIVPSSYDGLVTWKRYNKSVTEFENDTQHSLVENQFDYLVNTGAYQISKQQMAKGGNVTNEDKLLKELHRLQRELNSGRLSTYKKGDNSEEEIARQKERESKLTRFNEILKTLRESDAKFADGGSLPFMTDPNFGDFQNTGAFANGGSIGDLTEQEYLKKHFSTSVFMENPSRYFEIKKLSSSDDDKVSAFVKELKADGFTVKKRAFSDFTSVMGVKKKGSFELGGAFVMTDLAGHTGGSDGLGSSSALNGFSGTYYTNLVGETGAMSSGEMFASGGSLGKALYVAYSSYFDSNKYDEEKIMSALKSIGAKNIHLEKDNGMFNLPEVVVFNGNKRQAEDALNEEFDTEYVIVREKDWRFKKMADGGFMNNVYADGGDINGALNKKIQKLADVRGFEISDWATSEYNKIMVQALVESLTDANFHDEAKQVVLKAERKTKWSNDLYKSESFNPDEKVASFAREVARECDYDGDDIVNAYFFITKMAGSKVATMIEDLFLNKKPANSSSKPKKYIDHDDIKSVTVKYKGKEVSFKGEDVLNGANLMEKGGDLSKIAFYIAKRDVISVELKNGETIKPMNGYWVKKGAEPLSNPSGTTKSKTDENKAHFQADPLGNVFVDSNFVNQSQGNLPNTELKHYGYGDFYLQTPDGNIDFIRTSEEKEGFVGRTHKMKGSDELVLKLVNAMKEKGRFESTQTFAHGGEMDEADITSELEDFDIDELDDFETMQYNQFLPSSGKVGALQILINNVEGDYSQLSEELAELAEKQMSSEEYDESTRDMRFERDGYANGGAFKPYGKTKGRYIVNYTVDSEKQSEIWDTKEMAVTNAKRYTKIDEYSDIMVFDENGKKVEFLYGGFYANGGIFNDNEGFMRADNNNNYRYPEREVNIDTFDEPIDLTDNVSSRSNEVVIRPLNEDIDLKEDSRLRARIGFNPTNRSPNKMMAVNPRMVITNLPKTQSSTHKND